LQIGQRKSFFQHQRARQPQRPRPDHREIIDRAARRELADVPARKAPGAHDEGIAGKRQPLTGKFQNRRVACRTSLGTEHRQDQAGEQLVHHPPAAAMADRHMLR